MGFFSRQDSAAQQGRAGEQDQLKELRRRARRRLIGALALVLIAVIFVPLFLKSDGADEIEQVVQVFPPIVAPDKAPPIESSPWQDEVVDPEQELTPVDEPSAPVNVDELLDAQVAAIEQERERAEPKPAEPEDPAPEKPEPQPQSKPKPTKPAEPERTDDGSVALALLEARMSPDAMGGPSCNSQPAASQYGCFTVQVAAYSSKEGADQRRQQLSSAGVNNAFVESGSGAAGTTYRLRVGPFETRQAAEAALTRLRSLGYEDSFIRSQ